MGEVGFNASERESLPLLFKEVFKIPLKTNCPQCIKDGWNSLMGWYKKKTTKPNTYMAFKIKPEYHEISKGVIRNFTFMQNGRRIQVNHLNLNEEKAHLMLASKYAHAIEGTPETTEEAYRGSLDGIVKKEDSPNESDATVSTSKGASKGVTVSKSKGKKKLSKSATSKP